MCREGHWYGTTAVGDVRLLIMPRTLIFDVLEDHIEMAMELLRNFAKGLSVLLEMVAQRKQAAAAAE
jgi:CRP-like cAMP-binding protein